MSQTVEGLVKQVKELVEAAEADASKCDKGNRQAGIRVRKSMMSIIDAAKTTRQAVLDARG